MPEYLMIEMISWIQNSFKENSGHWLNPSFSFHRRFGGQGKNHLLARQAFPSLPVSSSWSPLRRDSWAMPLRGSFGRVKTMATCPVRPSAARRPQTAGLL